MKIKYKNQIIIYVIAFMLVTAGYLNYTERNSVEVSSENNQNRTDENIGDAKLVNSNDTVQENYNNGEEKQSKNDENNKKDNNDEKVSNNESDIKNEKDSKEQNNINGTNSKADSKNENNNDKNETVTTNSNKTNSSDYFTSSKMERDNMYSQMLENYQKMLNNTNISEDQKSIASQEIKNINNTKNSIMICENLITTKGFENVVIFVNGNSVNVVVKSNKLEQEQVAQIQNIITREINTEIENIHIMTH
ncbi:MAG: SpoIIIAH-like family protein [Clostridia bacterium]|nr:SpoIIIAH-like family protein [Clostridia bacterium]